LGREFEGKDERWGKYDEIESARGKMMRANRELLEKLAELTGDPRPN
jgi:hypothetical protein